MDVSVGVAPRGCPGHDLSLDIALKIVAEAMPRPNDPPTPLAELEQAGPVLSLEEHARESTTERDRAFVLVSPTADAAQYLYFAMGCANLLGGIVIHAIDPAFARGEMVLSVGAFTAGQVLVTAGWFALTQQLKLGEIYLPGDSGLVQVKNWLGMLHFIGYIACGYSMLRMGIILRYVRWACSGGDGVKPSPYHLHLYALHQSKLFVAVFTATPPQCILYPFFMPLGTCRHLDQ
mmetsp:Transcript_10422/g.32018  ORF Transcript_10422/g.32018 Transcript_10422/m.32018 type:complete len:234 (+) Transcript_10422:1670-2371(+)